MKSPKIKLLMSALYGLTFLFCVKTVAQSLPEIVPPSPEAASLIKHSQMDVSLYTGTPGVSVPFHNISYEGVNIPIGIGYNSGGIKVGDIASWVGLGWNLNAGGLVSRSMRSLPDDKQYYGYMNTSYTVEDLFQRDPYASITDPNSQVRQLSLSQANSRDYEPDIFNFSFPGGSGQFFYDQSVNKFVQTPYSNLIIETKTNSIDRITGFIITNTQGVKFHFGTSSDNTRTGLEAITGAKTKTKTYTGVYDSDATVYGSPASPYYQTWMLMDIEFPTSNKSISFDYTAETNVKTSQLQNEEYIHASVTSGCPNEYNIIYLIKEFTQPKIASITFPEGKVVFEKSTTERLDLHNSYPLEKIKLFDNDNQLIKGIELHTSYFTSAISANSYFDNYNEGIYRLKLDAISQFGQNESTSLKPYEFEYNAKILPDRYARSQDYFGYYNGKNNTTLIPKATYGVAISGYIGDADRSVDPEFTTACSLEKIIYPSGGYDAFVWENNKITSFTGDASDYVDYLIQDSFYFTNDPFVFGDSDMNIDYSKTFIIPSNSNGVVNFNIMMSGCPVPTNFNDTGCDFTLKVVGVTNPGFLLNIFNSSFDYTFPAGTYKITANFNGSSSGCDPMTDPSCTGGGESFGATLKWTTDPTPNEYMYGGLRIAQINTYDTPTNLALSRNFSYTNFVNNTDVSSGRALNFVDLSMEKYRGGACSPNLASGLKIVSNNQAQLTLTKGSLVGYENVTESYSGLIGNGHREYTFSTANDRFDNIYLGASYYGTFFPSNLETPVLSDWSAGNLEKLEYYNKDNDLVKKETYEYEAYNTNHAEYFGIQILRMPLFANSGDNMYVKPYSYTSEWYRPKKTTTTSYFGNQEVVSVTDHIYENNPLLASKTITSTSDEESIITKMYYPDDVDLVSALGHDNLTSTEKAAIDRLKSPTISNPTRLHRIGIPIQTETYTDFNDDGTANANELISTQRSIFKNWGNDLVLPEIIQTAKGGGNLEDRIVYQDYYDNGNIKEVSKKDGSSIVYLWGYNEQYPVAKIENAIFSDIPITIYNAILSKSDLDDDNTENTAGKEGDLRVELNKLRNNTFAPNLADAQITTYTYDPLIGVTSATDANGYISYYRYDEFNRLQYIKNKDGKVLEQYNYNYKVEELLATTISSASTVTSGTAVTFTTTPTGGSGNFTYEWTVFNGNINQTTTTSVPSFTVTTTSNHAPNFTVTCKVIDTQTNQEETTTTQVNVTIGYPALNVGFITSSPSVGAPKSVGQMVTYSIGATGGSGNYSYAWSKTNSQITTNFTNNTSSLNNTITPGDCSTFTVKCVVTDTTTNQSITRTTLVLVTSGCSGPGGPGDPIDPEGLGNQQQ